MKLEKLKDLHNFKVKELKELFENYENVKVFLHEKGFRVVGGPKKIKKLLNRRFKTEEDKLLFKKDLVKKFGLEDNTINKLSFKKLRGILKYIEE